MTQHPTTEESTDERSLSSREQRAAVRERYAAAAAADSDKSEETATVAADSDESEETATVAANSDESEGVESNSLQQSSCCGGAASGTTAGTQSDSNTDSGSNSSSCCGDDSTLASHGRRLGYSNEELESVAAGANLGLGCGNPNAIAELAEGETVLDLGSGGGFDCFLASRAVGPTGSVIGVDMTPEMIDRARANVEKNEVDNVEFRLGEIENLPVPDEHVDVIISNCVINLSPAKGRVFEEAYRVLRPGGRLAISDVVLTAEVPAELHGDPDAITACVAGAAPIDELESLLADTGFVSVSIRPKAESEEFIREWSDEYPLEAFLTSAVIEGTKPS